MRTNSEPAESRRREVGGWGGWADGWPGGLRGPLTCTYSSHSKRLLPPAVPWRVTPLGGGAPGWRGSATSTPGTTNTSRGARAARKRTKQRGSVGTVHFSPSVNIHHAVLKRKQVPHARSRPPKWVGRLHARWLPRRSAVKGRSGYSIDTGVLRMGSVLFLGRPRASSAPPARSDAASEDAPPTK